MRNLFRKTILFVMLFTTVMMNCSLILVQAADDRYLSYSNSVTGYSAVIADEASLLTDSERSQLLNEMAGITEYGNVVFLSTNRNNMGVSTYAESYYEKLFGYTDGIIFLIDMDNRELWINSHEKMQRIINKSFAYTITDNVYRMASANNFYGCASSTFEQIYRVLEGNRINQPMKYTSNFFIGIVLALIFNYFLARILSSTAKPSNKAILDSIRSIQQVRNFYPHHTSTTRRYSPRSSGSSGGGGGGGHSSGGGHSF